MENTTRSDATLSEFLKTPVVLYFIEPLLIGIGAFFIAKSFLSCIKSLQSGYSQSAKSLFEECDLMQKYGEYAIITNITDPLGSAFAREFARRGFSLILIKTKSDDEFDNILPSIDRRIQRNKGRDLRIITKDDDETDETMYEKLDSELQNFDIKDKIGILVNNVGIAAEDGGSFLCGSLRDVLGNLHDSIIDMIMVTRSVLKIMLHNGKGLIVTVTTPANCRQFKKSGFPDSVRHFERHFNRILHRELSKHKKTQVKVETVHPGRICVRVDCRCEGAAIPKPEKFVRVAFTVLGRINSSSGYWIHSLQEFLSDFLPDRIVRFLVEANAQLIKKAEDVTNWGCEPVPSKDDPESGINHPDFY